MREVIWLDSVVMVLIDLTYLKSFKAIQDERLVFQQGEGGKKDKETRVSVFAKFSKLLYHRKATLTSLKSWLFQFRSVSCNKLSVKRIHSILQLSTQFKRLQEHTGLLQDDIWCDWSKNTPSQNFIFSDLFPKRGRCDSKKLMGKTWLRLWPLFPTCFPSFPSIHHVWTFSECCHNW